MKKLFLLIAGIFLFSITSAYDVIIYGPNNESVFMFPIEEGTTEITLEGDRSKNGNNYTFNNSFDGLTVNYVDGYGKESEILITSDLYLNGDYSIGYTGEQYLMLSSNECGDYKGYVPVFDITGNITEVSTSGNIFNNFAENSVKFTLSNIPSYIQYVIIFMILLFILGFIRKFRR